MNLTNIILVGSLLKDNIPFCHMEEITMTAINSFNFADPASQMHQFADHLYQVANQFCHNDTERNLCDDWYRHSFEFGSNVASEDFEAANASLNALSAIFNDHIKGRNQELSLLLGALLLKYQEEFLLQFDHVAEA